MTPSSANTQLSAPLSVDDMARRRSDNKAPSAQRSDQNEPLIPARLDTAGHCRFDLAGATSAGLLPRALETIARLDIAPVECRAPSGPEVMTISLTYHGLTAAQANTAANRMRNIHGVHAVTLVLSTTDTMTHAVES